MSREGKGYIAIKGHFDFHGGSLAISPRITLSAVGSAVGVGHNCPRIVGCGSEICWELVASLEVDIEHRAFNQILRIRLTNHKDVAVASAIPGEGGTVGGDALFVNSQLGRSGAGDEGDEARCVAPVALVSCAAVGLHLHSVWRLGKEACQRVRILGDINRISNGCAVVNDGGVFNHPFGSAAVFSPAEGGSVSGNALVGNGQLGGSQAARLGGEAYSLALFARLFTAEACHLNHIMRIGLEVVEGNGGFLSRIVAPF